METRPSWLPELINVDGEWNEVLSRLYAVFVRDFKRAALRYDGRRVRWDSRIMPDNQYEEGFWHLITKHDWEAGTRLLEPRRAERLPWGNPTISNHNTSFVTAFDYEEGRGAVRTYLWLKEHDYVVVLQKRGAADKAVAMLITAFYVSGDSTRRELLRKYGQRQSPKM